MLKNIKYETKDINEVVLDLAEEIKLGWKLYNVGCPCVETSLCYRPEITVEVTLKKEFQHDK